MRSQSTDSVFSAVLRKPFSFNPKTREILSKSHRVGPELSASMRGMAARLKGEKGQKDTADFL